VGLKLNGAYQFLVYTDDMYLLEDNIESIKKNTDTLTEASKEVGLAVNIQKLSICWCPPTRMQVKIRRKENAGICVTVQIFGNDGNG
jgi:hypothetical protein